MTASPKKSPRSSPKKSVRKRRTHKKKHVDGVYRSFAVTYVNGRKIKKHGTILSRNPRSAASKAATKLCRKMRVKSVTVTVQETTRESKHRFRTYRVTKQKVKSPRVVPGAETKKGKPVTLMYKNKLKAVANPRGC